MKPAKSRRFSIMRESANNKDMEGEEEKTASNKEGSEMR